MTYDAFLFCNELDVLEIRLTELAPVVDRFILFESTETFSGRSKLLNYQLNASRYAAWASKITVVTVPWMGGQQNAWLTEMSQRDYAINQLRTMVGPGDYVLWGDCDEIPKREMIATAQASCDAGHIVAFQQPYYLYFLNWKAAGFGDACLTRMSKGWKLDRPANPPVANFWRAPATAELASAGWHFSFMGGAATIEDKLNSFSHQELNTAQINNPAFIAARLLDGADLFGRQGISSASVTVDNTFPHALVENPTKWAALVK